MEEANLIVEAGHFESTGGRKAQILRINRLAKVAVGVELLKDQVRILAVDLYGSIIGEKTYSCIVNFDESCMVTLGNSITGVIADLNIPPENVLGVKIALQGLLSSDGTVLTYSKIYPCNGLSAADFQKYIPYPCSLIHDTETAAFAELCFYPDIRDAVILFLNTYFGGALIINRGVYQGQELSSGTIEHMCIDPNGARCYCGKKGCIDTVCSVRVLEEQAGEDLCSFFTHLRKGDPGRQVIWERYLKQLAHGISNIRMIIDCDFVIGGHLLSHLTSEDARLLEKMVQERCAFPSSKFRIRLARCGTRAPALGAALLLVERFLADCGFDLEYIRKRMTSKED